MNPGVTACVTVLALSLPVCVHAASADELADIRQQMESLQQQYETRLKELETRLEQAEAQVKQNRAEISEAKTAPPAAATATYPETATSSGTPAAANAFNPALSVVLQGSVNSYSENPDNYALPGFQLGDEGGLANQGLTLDETEVTASANVDPLFYGQTTLSLSDQSNGGTEISIEEAFVDPHDAARGAGRALWAVLFRYRLSQPVSLPCLGFPRRAAGLPGLSQQAIRRRRRAPRLGGADRHLPHDRRRDLRRQSFPRRQHPTGCSATCRACS